MQMMKHKHLSCWVHAKQAAFLLEARASWSSRATQAAHSNPSANDTSQQAHMENWYPGHMQKAVRDMQGRLKQVDLIIEVRDARVPMSACSTVMEGLLRGKRRIIVLNKADLVPKEDLKLALSSQAKRSLLRTMAVSANDPESVKRLMRASLEVVNTERATADESLLMVVGLPNAGKSSIINDLKACAARARLLDGQNAYHKKAKTGPLPGVTRALGSFQLSKQPRVFVLDTPGVLPPAIQDPQAALNIALTGGMPVSVTDSTILVRHLLWLLLQRPQKYAQLLQDHLAADTQVAQEARTDTHVAEKARGETYVAREAQAGTRMAQEAHTDTHVAQEAHEDDRAERSENGGLHMLHERQDQPQQQLRGARTHRRAQQPMVSLTPQSQGDSESEWQLARHQQHQQQPGQQQQHQEHQQQHSGSEWQLAQHQQHQHQPSQHSQPTLPRLHKACSSVAKALIEALVHTQQLQHTLESGRPAGTQIPHWDGQYLSLHQGAHAAGPGADPPHDVVDLDSPAEPVDSCLHHLIVLLSRDSRRGPRGWGKVSRQASEVPVSAAQRQGACNRVLWAFRKGQLGRLMLDDII
ncbi:P-loop containing nucleoside triphosphate hydrolase protein [Dunaliella salina]|uniref:P-loop containing nucleoside triphosphate hydrolase protein n=1 Tax=Dunaliella salina TaxID=3046 RepID=A0ABQ7GK27_DUNSA|nr:P-loop containing nucleoside triphosphate hydrolase protein [Dunaliella salina]|eukprot:KAF5834933.1 P-loop containing nucleoside triphosphate hydrolase protein [Dunaliella salina]